MRRLHCKRQGNETANMCTYTGGMIKVGYTFFIRHDDALSLNSLEAPVLER